MICLNGAAARCVQKGDKIIIMCYMLILALKKQRLIALKVVFVDEYNKISRLTSYESTEG